MGSFNRTISVDHNDTDYVWHRDRRDRKVVPLQCKDWYIQFDNEMPIKMEEGKEIFIEKDIYHRVIKGKGDLKLQIWES
jgi:hypothetical protein